MLAAVGSPVAPGAGSCAVSAGAAITNSNDAARTFLDRWTLRIPRLARMAALPSVFCLQGRGHDQRSDTDRANCRRVGAGFNKDVCRR
jgi:hypothetical protein